MGMKNGYIIRKMVIFLQGEAIMYSPWCKGVQGKRLARTRDKPIQEYGHG